MRTLLPVLFLLLVTGCNPSEPSIAAPENAALPAPAATEVAPQAASLATFEGYGDMRLGSTVDEARAAWGGELDGAPVEGTTCHYLMPHGVKLASEFGFMMEDGRFVRYDVGTEQEVAPGGGKVGMQADALHALYGEALTASPHKYVEGGQYLSMDADGTVPSRLVFETDAAGKVVRWRVGLLPQADYVEGCS